MRNIVEKKTISPDVKEELNKIVKLSTDFNGNLNIENLRLLAHNKIMHFKKEGKSEQFIKEFKLFSRKAEGKIVNVSEHTKFSPSKSEPINISQYVRTLPGDKNKKPEQLNAQDYWKLQKEFINYIKAQNLTEKQTIYLINSLPSPTVYRSGSYPYQRKPPELIRKTLEYRSTLEEKIREMKQKN